jgi:hypothetical protein
MNSTVPALRIAHGLGQRDGLFAHGLAGRRVKEGRGRLFDDLLVAALDRAFALVQIDARCPCLSASTWISIWRGCVTNFSMKMRSSPKLFAASFFEDSKAFARLLIVPGDAHALAAAAGAGLDHHRIADLAAMRTASSASAIRPI